MADALRVIFAGGGTLGHLFPGLAVAQQVRAMDDGAQVLFTGRDDPRETDVLAAAGFPHQAVPCRPAPRRLGDLLASLTANARGYRVASGIVRWYRPDVVVGLGGYASAATCLAALRARVPLILLEQNVVPGVATRWLARWARTVCTTFSSTAAHLPRSARVLVTGNPVREVFLKHQQPICARPARHRRRTLAVFGGTSGAAALNLHLPEVFARLRVDTRGWRILHQAGAGRAEAVASGYRRLRLSAEVREFFDDPVSFLGPDTVAVARAGGSTLAELAVTGTPAVLVPYPYAAAGHQQANAQEFVTAGAAFAVTQSDLQRGPEPLLGALRLLLNADVRRGMSAAMRRLAQPAAAARVATLCYTAAGRAVDASVVPLSGDLSEQRPANPENFIRTSAFRRIG